MLKSYHSSDRRSCSVAKPRKSQKQLVLCKGQLIPLSKNSPCPNVAKIRPTAAGRAKNAKTPAKVRVASPHLTRCISSVSFCKKSRSSEKCTNSYSRLPPDTSIHDPRTASSGHSAATESARLLKTSDRKSLDQTIRQKLQALPSRASERLDVLQSMFQLLIDVDKPFSLSLQRLKTAYDDVFQLAQAQAKEPLRMELDTANQVLSQFKVDAKVMRRKIEKLARENYELSKSLDDKENDMNELQERILQISQVNVDAVPKNLETWKFIVTENKSYHDFCKSLKHDLKAYQSKEKTLVRLLTLLKERGCPVEEVYAQEILKQELVPATPRDDTDNELLVSGTAPFGIKPETVPSLNLGQIEPDSDSNSSAPVSNAEIPLYAAIHGKQYRSIGHLSKAPTKASMKSPSSSVPFFYSSTRGSVCSRSPAVQRPQSAKPAWKQEVITKELYATEEKAKQRWHSRMSSPNLDFNPVTNRFRMDFVPRAEEYRPHTPDTKKNYPRARPRARASPPQEKAVPLSFLAATPSVFTKDQLSHKITGSPGPTMLSPHIPRGYGFQRTFLF